MKLWFEICSFALTILVAILKIRYKWVKKLYKKIIELAVNVYEKKIIKAKTFAIAKFEEQ